MKRGLIITVDGPAGSGKSTVAKRLAQPLGFTYLDTGAIYRAITLKALRSGILPNQTNSLTRTVNQIRIVFKVISDQPRIILDNQDVTELIREPWVTENVFRYAELPLVRKAMVRFQRRLAAKGNIVAEGRDMSSVVFPDAGIKFYLDATPEVRARRRFRELQSKKPFIKYNEVLRDLKVRDRRDKTRKLAPLKKTKDAIYLDTTRLTIKQVVSRLRRIIRGKSRN